MFNILASPEIWHRDDFPLLCNWRKLWRVVEVGVDRGEFAQMFLQRWQGEEYTGVDDYRPFLHSPDLRTIGFRDTDCTMALSRLAPHGKRFRLLRMPSVEASACFGDKSLDFVYLDAGHDLASVKSDIKAWWPKLSEQGILGGHDWTDLPEHDGVKPAVVEFAKSIRQPIYVTQVAGYQQETCPSWYIYKAGMPPGDWKRC